jgi:hypothetical protein
MPSVISEMGLFNYMFNFVYNLGESDAKVRPLAAR